MDAATKMKATAFMILADYEIIPQGGDGDELAFELSIWIQLVYHSDLL